MTFLQTFPVRGSCCTLTFIPHQGPPNFTSSKWFSSKLGLCVRRQSPEGFPEEAAENWQDKGVAQAETVGRPSHSNVPWWVGDRAGGGGGLGWQCLTLTPLKLCICQPGVHRPHCQSTHHVPRH